ncbi:formate dehydrogenase subunit beta [Desulfurococcaceae archaeon AG1]|nr:formate dehydrogenase subunit beta [Desulfurococcaceae archaeon AG1]
MGVIIDMAKRETARGRVVYGVGLDRYIGGGTRWVYVASKERSAAMEKILPHVPKKKLDPYRWFFVSLKRRVRLVALISMLNRFIRKRLGV